MGFIDWMRNLFGVKQKPLDDGTVEQAFNVTPAASRVMKSNIALWYDIYTNRPFWCDPKRNGGRDDIAPLGFGGAVCRELTRFALSEFNMTISGSPRADYLNQCAQDVLVPAVERMVEYGLAFGGCQVKPYIDQRFHLMIDITGANSFAPVEFDGTGMALSGVAREVVEYNKQTYCRLEYQGFEGDMYVAENKAYKGETGGGQEIDLATVPQWANYWKKKYINRKGDVPLDRPLFAYFKNPSSNDIDPTSQIGVSVFGGAATCALLEQADRQWEQIQWEYDSGRRKVFSDGSRVKASQFLDDLFEFGDFTSTGDLFNVFSPEFRDDALYRGFQHTLQRIEYNVGLSFGTISDPQTVERTATEILAAKNRQRITVNAIQKAAQKALDTVVYAMDVYCDLWTLAPAGDYEVTYNWGDGVLDDPDTIRQDKAMMLQEISAGITNPWEYRVKWLGESREEAEANLPRMEEMTEPQDSGEIE